MRQFRLRIRYGKEGKCAWLSHLELTHALERVVRRSGLPFALTQGFSPHMKMAFGPALPVGVGGAFEVFDVVLSSYVPVDQALESLKACEAPNLPMKECAYVDTASPAASVAFSKSIYEVCLSEPLDRLVIPSVVTVLRKGKERQFETQDFLADEPRLTEDGFTFSLVSKDTGSLRADAFANAVLKASAEDAGSAPQVTAFTRTSLG
ncbi:MAG: DUF2344 domain-containing protein [Eggerthellaceae bacterium]|nr:DUF2344 domain-containing protein [Eggerthellaceae bacterium]